MPPPTRRAPSPGPPHGSPVLTRSTSASSRSVRAPGMSGALIGGGKTASERVKRLRQRLLRGPIPAPAVRPHGSNPETLTYTDFLFSQFQPMRSPASWPQNASDIDASVRGDGSALEIRLEVLHLTHRLGRSRRVERHPMRSRTGRQEPGRLGGRSSSETERRAGPKGWCMRGGTGARVPLARRAARTTTGARGTPRRRLRSC